LAVTFFLAAGLFTAGFAAFFFTAGLLAFFFTAGLVAFGFGFAAFFAVAIVQSPHVNLTNVNIKSIRNYTRIILQ
jgi:hypothetical protein